VNLAAVGTRDLDFAVPRFGERPHVSCYGRLDRALSGWAKHGQMICVALGVLFRSLHIGLPLIQRSRIGAFSRSADRAQRRPDKYASGIRKMRSTAVRSYVGDPT
jgi:hypothetical protein